MIPNFIPHAARHIARKPDRYYENLLRAAKIAEVPVPMMRVALVAVDANGEETGRYEGWSRTYVRNFHNNLFGLLCAAPPPAANYNDGHLALKNTAGAISTPSYNAVPQPGIVTGTTQSWWFYGAGSNSASVAAITNQGIVVGTGTVPESFNAFALANQLAHGNLSGQISYTGQNATIVTWNGVTRQFSASMVRIFNNNSGAPIIVTESGLLANIANTGALSSSLLWRDLLAAPVTVANAGQLTVTYTMIMQFPADVVEQPPMGGARKDQIQRQVYDAWDNYHTPRTVLSRAHQQNQYTTMHYLEAARFRRGY